MNTVKEKKALLRKELSQKRKQLDRDVKREMDDRICKYILSMATYRYADTVLLYYPLQDEVDITPVLKRAWQDKKTVLLPRCSKDESGVMDFFVVTCQEELESGAFGVMEPKLSCPIYSREGFKPSFMCVMPAMTFDKDGFRLGYGKGYYDRYLQGFDGIKVGVVYSDFIYSRVPHGYYDVKADIIVTEKGVNSLNER